jgi:methionine sulfoxide reductase heme-binding subunit
MKDPTFWILARASGLTAYVLLTLSVLAGLVLKSRPLGRKLNAAAVTDTHRFLATLGLGAVGLHALTLVLDSTIRVSLPALIVPGLVAYRPLWVALGVVAVDLMVLVIVSFPLRKRIGMKAWRRLHWATYAIFGLATIHGLAAGTDTPTPWAFSLYVGAVGSVVFATAWRALARPVRPTVRQTAKQGGNHVPHPDRPVSV